jgi:hypothetical protein
MFKVCLAIQNFEPTVSVFGTAGATGKAYVGCRMTQSNVTSNTCRNEQHRHFQVPAGCNAGAIFLAAKAFM